MRCTFTIFLLFVLLSGPVAHAQNTLVGTAAANEYAYGTEIDSAGNTYTCGSANNRPWIFRSDSGGNIIWSTVIGTAAEQGDITYIQAIGHTVFGCGWRRNGASIIGGIYFKMNATTGVA